MRGRHPPKCDDNDVCTGTETCDAALGCVAGEPLVCSDDNACNGAETCHAELGCSPGEPLKCDDGDGCNGVETCDVALGCVSGQPMLCDDAKACNGVETCHAVLGCQSAPLPLACDDGLKCNGLETCDDAVGCVSGDTLACDDGDPCNGVETCDDAQGCVNGPLLDCDDGDACNGEETCTAGTGCEAGEAPLCDDEKPCNGVETCDAKVGCVAGEPPLGCCENDAACDDQKACNGVETCDQGSKTCVLGVPPVCDDANACNGVETCDNEAALPGCVAAGVGPDCDDANPCTEDTCQASQGCVHAPAVGACNDGDPCTTNDACGGGLCLGGAPKSCDDGDACNGQETCTPNVGCGPGAALVCNDGNACNGVETCAPESGCVLGTPLGCDDGNACTIDMCDALSGCTQEPAAGPCDDLDPCTAGTVCVLGACGGGEVTSCDDGVECTIDMCVEGQGCLHDVAAEAAVVNITGVAADAVSAVAVIPEIEVLGPQLGEPLVLLDGAPFVSGTPVLQPGAHTLSVSITDCASALHITSLSFSVDPTGPELSAEVKPAPNAAGWHNVPVTVTFSATDEFGEVATISEPQLVATPGQAVKVVGTATDSAGNESSLEVSLDLDFKAPSILITSPVVNQDANDQFVTAADVVTFQGTIGDDSLSGFAGGQVSSSKLEGEILLDTPGPFSVEIPLKEGVNTVIVSGNDVAGNTGTASVCVIRDGQPPVVAIQYPTDGLVTTDSSLTVSGFAHDVVVGAVTEEDVVVTVNGLTAQATNGSFVVEAVPLELGDNVLEAIATDAVGHVAKHAVTVHRLPPGDKSLAIISGDAQQGEVAAPAAAPLVVKLSTAAGDPVANGQVLFAITDNNGTLSHPSADAVGPNGRELLFITGADGLAHANWTLGDSAGAGKNRVTITSPGVLGSVSAFATGLAKTALNIYPHAGLNQIGTSGEPLPMPFSVLVTDDKQNPVDGMPVTFQVIDGNGKFANGLAVTVTSNAKGFADVVFTPGDEQGPAAHRVVASIAQPGDDSSDTQQGVTFTAGAYAAKNPKYTAIRGVVLDDDQKPLPGVTLSFPAVGEKAVVTDANGRFFFHGAPAGFALLDVNGATAAPDLSGITYAHMVMELNNIEGIENVLDRPIYVPRLNEGAWVDGSETVTLTLAELPGFELTIPAGTKVTFPNGSHEGVVSLTQINFDQAPMPPINGLQSRVLVTIQPPGVAFDPPAPLQLPNVDGYPAGRKVDMFSYDHDLEAFVAIGTGSVSADATVIRSDPGVGVIKGGWHCGANPGGQGSSAAISASLARTGSDGGTINLMGTGGPAEGTSWQFCSSGDVAVSGGGCANKAECPATATLANGDVGRGKVKVVHTCTETGDFAEDVREVTICETAKKKDKWEIDVPLKDLLEGAIAAANAALSPIGCELDASLTVNVEGEKYETCCLGCPGMKATNGSVFASIKAAASGECAIPGLGFSLDFGIVEVSVGFSGIAELTGKIGVKIDDDNCCPNPPCRTYGGGVEVEVKAGGSFTLIDLEVGDFNLVDISADLTTGIKGAADINVDGEGSWSVCWNGLIFEASVSFLDGFFSPVKKEFVLACPRELMSDTFQVGAPPADPGGGGCGTELPAIPEPSCGSGGGDEGDPDGGGGDPDNGGGSGNTGFAGDCGTCPDGFKCQSHSECSDFNVCNGIEQCDGGGGCTPGTPLECDDGVECTTDKCNQTKGCVYTPVHEDCDDGVICTKDVCSKTDGCAHVPVPADCSDGIACTADSCDLDFGCQNDPKDNLCADPFACTVDQCTPGVGCEHLPQDDDCPDKSDCTTKKCSVGAGCLYTAQHSQCDDGFECTADSCDPTEGCKHQPNNAACNDGIACTGDACDVDEGCKNTPDDTLCSDAHACTDDSCGTNGCQHDPQDNLCTDGVVCTSDSCDPALGCQFQPQPSSCADGIACTNDACDPNLDCINALDHSKCDDGAACTADTCTAGGCVHTPNDANCADGAACTTDTCTAFTGCTNVPDNAACSDGVGCTADLCTSGGCTNTPNSALCQDGVGCTADSCHATLDCQNVPNHAVCADGTACTVDKCVGGVGCVSAPSHKQCKDGDACTSDRCVAGVGCQHNGVAGCVSANTCTTCPGGCAHCGKIVCESGARFVWEPDPAGGACVKKALAGCPNGEVGAAVCLGGVPTGYHCQADACVVDEAPCAAGLSCLEGDGLPAACVGCCQDADCPREGINFCEGGSPKVFTCQSNACVDQPVACTAGQSGPLSCDGDQSDSYTCGTSGCSEVLMTDCAASGQVCETGECEVAP